MHRRRVALGAGLAAAVLAVTGGLVAATQRDDDGDSTPIEPPDDRAPAEVVEYPGPVMETLDAGTYLLQPSWEDTAPRARLDLPAGWNAWQGPNRFDGDLDTTTWYAGLLVVEVDAVASKPCVAPQSDDVVGDSRAELVAALQRIPGARVSVDEVPDEMFGYPATHLQMTFPVPRPQVPGRRQRPHHEQARHRRRRRRLAQGRLGHRRRRQRAPGGRRLQPEDAARDPAGALRHGRLDRDRLPGVSHQRQAGKPSPLAARSRRYGVGRNRSPYFSASSSARFTNAARPISPVSASS